MNAVQERIARYKKAHAAAHIATGTSTYYEDIDPGEVPHTGTVHDLGDVRVWVPKERFAEFAEMNATIAWAKVSDVQEAFPLENYTIARSPYDLLFGVADEVNRIHLLVDKIERSPNIVDAKKISTRLRQLIEIVEEEFPEEETFSIASLEAFAAFLEENTQIKSPSIVRTPSGNVRAQWKRDRERHFVIEFHSIAKCGFVIFTPNVEEPENPIRLSGIAPVSQVVATSTPHGVMEWIAVDEG